MEWACFFNTVFIRDKTCLFYNIYVQEINSWTDDQENNFDNVGTWLEFLEDTDNSNGVLVAILTNMNGMGILLQYRLYSLYILHIVKHVCFTIYMCRKYTHELISKKIILIMLQQSWNFWNNSISVLVARSANINRMGILLQYRLYSW